jgi:hypothetical protein
MAGLDRAAQERATAEEQARENELERQNAKAAAANFQLREQSTLKRVVLSNPTLHCDYPLFLSLLQNQCHVTEQIT